MYKIHTITMDILKAFKLNDVEIQINISGTEDEPLFQANQIGNLLEIANIRQNIRDFDDSEKVVITTYTLGGSQQTTFLTEVGLYRLLGMSRKPIARVFQKWVVQVVKELRKTGRYELSKAIEVEKKLARANIEMERHNALLSSFKNKNVLYLSKLKEMPNNTYILKIGYTDDISNRHRMLCTNFGSSTFLHVFECNNNRKLEKMLKKHPEFCKRRYIEEIIEGIKSTETYLVSSKDMDILLKIITTNLANYQGFNPEQFIEMEKIKLENRRLDIQQDAMKMLMPHLHNGTIEGVVQSIQSIFIPPFTPVIVEAQTQECVVHEDETKHIISKFARTNTTQRRVQQYTSDTFTLLKTYDGLMDVIRQNKEMSKYGVKQAAMHNSTYRGYRWHFIDVNAEVKQYDIPPTVNTQASSIPRHIAMINKDKTQIENVFASLQLAAEAINSNRKTTICNAIKNDKLVRNMYYFQYLDDCDETLRFNYLANHTLPSVICPKGTAVEQIDMHSGQVVQQFNSIANVLKAMNISRASIKHACATGEAHNGYLWKFTSV